MAGTFAVWKPRLAKKNDEGLVTTENQVGTGPSGIATARC
jgi:hypothetical protein